VAGAGLLALLLAAAAKALRALGYAVPGLSRAEPFGNATRVGILEFVTGNPGVTVPVVAGRFQVGRATARHHLAVLERSQLVSCVRSGGAAFYTLNHETFMFPVGGAGTPTAGEAFHHFLHPARQQVRQALEALGGASYPEMAEHWRRAGLEVLPPDVVSYHCHKLLDLGLLVREPQGKAVRWRLAHRLDEALRHQRQAFLKHGGLGRLLDALRDGPASVDQVARRLGARGHRMGRAAIRGGLRVLAATGYAEDSPAGWRSLAPPTPPAA
jgi:DNA-binding transcriptional ArsR family regulator